MQNNKEIYKKLKHRIGVRGRPLNLQDLFIAMAIAPQLYSISIQKLSKTLMFEHTVRGTFNTGIIYYRLLKDTKDQHHDVLQGIYNLIYDKD